ncbi:hypothetical protein TSAR_012592 [Trichomalopsis sarcophagae]|uniref:Uncharacterized protein n=1 Tax=Trichomalopsis sarcophagae TaxID=543379 RepID=A0A232ERR6_9HYME|nr:hypothetical protein TSAR_012592 [Trichomalopsis sarcophagae]
MKTGLFILALVAFASSTPVGREDATSHEDSDVPEAVNLTDLKDSDLPEGYNQSSFKDLDVPEGVNLTDLPVDGKNLTDLQDSYSVDNDNPLSLRNSPDLEVTNATDFSRKDNPPSYQNSYPLERRNQTNLQSSYPIRNNYVTGMRNSYPRGTKLVTNRPSSYPGSRRNVGNLQSSYKPQHIINSCLHFDFAAVIDKKLQEISNYVHKYTDPKPSIPSDWIETRPDDDYYIPNGSYEESTPEYSVDVDPYGNNPDSDESISSEEDSDEWDPSEEDSDEDSESEPSDEYSGEDSESEPSEEYSDESEPSEERPVEYHKTYVIKYKPDKPAKNPTYTYQSDYKPVYEHNDSDETNESDDSDEKHPGHQVIYDNTVHETSDIDYSNSNHNINEPGKVVLESEDNNQLASDRISQKSEKSRNDRAKVRNSLLNRAYATNRGSNHAHKGDRTYGRDVLGSKNAGYTTHGHNHNHPKTDNGMNYGRDDKTDNDYYVDPESHRDYGYGSHYDGDVSKSNDGNSDGHQNGGYKVAEDGKDYDTYYPNRQNDGGSNTKSYSVSRQSVGGKSVNINSHRSNGEDGSSKVQISKNKVEGSSYDLDHHHKRGDSDSSRVKISRKNVGANSYDLDSERNNKAGTSKLSVSKNNLDANSYDKNIEHDNENGSSNVNVSKKRLGARGYDLDKERSPGSESSNLNASNNEINADSVDINSSNTN